MQTKKAKIVQFADWTALYIDGKLAAEGHSLSTEQVLDTICVPHETFSGDDEWAEWCGGMPEKFENVKLDESGG